MQLKTKGSMLGTQVLQECMYMYPSHISQRLKHGCCLSYIKTFGLIKVIGSIGLLVEEENEWAKRNLPHRNDATNHLLAVAATKYDDRRDRYSALSFQNPYTIEHRFFRSNMNEDGLMSRLEYIQATYDFVVVLSRLDKTSMFDAISNGLGKQLHMFICANSTEYHTLAHRLMNTNKFGVRSGFVSRSEVIPSLINGLEQARKEA